MNVQPKLIGKFKVVILCGETTSRSPDYQQAERKLVEDIMKEHKANIPPGQGRIKTINGLNLPNAGDESEIEGFVRTIQMMQAIGMRQYQVEFRQQDGFSFLVIYNR